MPSDENAQCESGTEHEDGWVAVETKEGDQRCYLCPEVFETNEELAEHMEEVHEPTGVSKGDRDA